MQIKIGNILYIYTFRVRASAGGGAWTLSPEQARLRSGLLRQLQSIMGIQPKNLEELAQLKKLAKVIGAVLGQLHKVPGGQMKAAIMEMVQHTLAAAANGDLSQALTIADSAEALTNQAVKAGERIGQALGRLNNLSSQLPAAAQKVVGDLIAHAEKMIEAASDPAQLEQVASLLEFAVGTLNTIVNMDPGSPAFQAGLRDLAVLGDELEATVPGGAQGPAMAQDELSLAFRSASESLAGLKEKTPDVFKKAKLDQLAATMKLLEERAAQAPDAYKAQLKSAINQILVDAANGKPDQAHQATYVLLNQVDQAAKLSQLVQAKTLLAVQVAGRLDAPLKAALTAVIAQAESARQAAKSPEEFKAIEESLLAAIKAAQEPSSTPAALAERVRRVKGCERELRRNDGASPAGRDSLELGLKGKHPQTQRLGPSKTARLHPPASPWASKGATRVSAARQPGRADRPEHRSAQLPQRSEPAGTTRLTWTGA